MRPTQPPERDDDAHHPSPAPPSVTHRAPPTPWPTEVMTPTDAQASRRRCEISVGDAGSASIQRWPRRDLSYPSPPRLTLELSPQELLQEQVQREILSLAQASIARER